MIVTGTVKKVLFCSEQESMYIFKVDTGSTIVACSGITFGTKITPGMSVTVTGELFDHPRYGQQVKIDDVSVEIKTTEKGICSYLTSTVKSIGPITAKKLYSHFGEKLIDILDNNIDIIDSVDFLSVQQKHCIRNEWSHSKNDKSLVVFLKGIGLSFNQIKSVISYFKCIDTLKDKIEKDPYILMDVGTIPFNVVDVAAINILKNADSDERMKYIILHAIKSKIQQSGDVFVVQSEMKSVVEMTMRDMVSPSWGKYIPDHIYYKSLAELESLGKIHTNELNVYTGPSWKYEYEAANSIADIIASGETNKFPNIESVVDEFEQKNNIKLSPEQRKALLSINEYTVSVITGYPGTGKTLLTSAIVFIFEKFNINYTLLSPTGIAAKNLTSVTSRQASTIHRAFGYKDGEWSFNKTNKYIVDAVIVDEVSMVCSETLYRLVTALDKNTIVVFIGDDEQLPSVGAGCVLSSLMKSSMINVTKLTKIYRQGRMSDIIKVSHDIILNNKIDLSYNEKSEFLFFGCDDSKVRESIESAVKSLFLKGADFQVISPMYKGSAGIDELNTHLRPILNKSFYDDDVQKVKNGDQFFYEGDRVIVIKNDYEKMVYNGDSGKIQRISTKDDEIVVKVFNWFNSEKNSYMDMSFSFTMKEAREKLKVAFAVSVHRMQGMAYDYILFPVISEHRSMLYRNLIYTAITRARKKVFVFGNKGAFSYGISNEKENERHSDLSDLIELCYDMNVIKQVML